MTLLLRYEFTERVAVLDDRNLELEPRLQRHTDVLQLLELSAGTVSVSQGAAGDLGFTLTPDLSVDCAPCCAARLRTSAARLSRRQHLSWGTRCRRPRHCDLWAKCRS